MEEKDFNIKEFIQWIMKYKMTFIFISLFVASLVVFGNKLIIPDTYEATALVSVKADTFKGAIETDAADRRENVRVFAEELLSRYILTQVIDDLGLVDLINSQTSTFQQYAGNVGMEVKRVPTTTENIIMYLQRNVEIAQSGGTNAYDNRAYVFTIKLEDKYPEIASKIVNKIAEVYITSKKTLKKNTASRTASFLSKEVDILNNKLAEIELEISNFKVANALYLVSEETVNDMISNVRTALIEAQSRAIIAHSTITSNSEDIKDITKYIVSTSDAQNRVTELQLELNQLLQVWKPENPLIISKQRELKLAKQAVGTSKAINPDYLSLKAAINMARAEKEAANAQKTILERELAALIKRQNRIPVATAELGVLEDKKRKVNEKLSVLSVKASDAQMHSDATDLQLTTNFVLVEKANTPTVPVIPSRLKFNVGGLIVGLLAGLLVAGLLGFFTKNSKKPITRRHFVVNGVLYGCALAYVIIIIGYIIMDYLKQSYIFG